MSLYRSHISRLVSGCRTRGQALGCIVLCMTLASGVTASPDWLQSPEAWANERVLYQKAVAELDSGAGNRYLEIRDALGSYPLRVDLDFAVRLGQLHDMTAEQALTFIQGAAGTPLASRFLVAYLRHKAQDRRWREFLDVLDAVPVMPELQCYYYLAQLSVGDQRAAYAGAATLWNVGFSQDDACDALFKEWIRELGPDDKLVWSRALKAFDAKNGHLIRYVKRFATPALQRDLEELAAVYRRPSRIEGDHHQVSERHTDILVAGLTRLAQLNPYRAYQAMISLSGHFEATDPKRDRVSKAIVKHSLFAERSPAPADWLQTQVQALKDDELTRIWLRKRIAEGRWRELSSEIGWLSPALRRQDRWRYWLVRSREAIGDDGIDGLWRDLASERSFHGFLAADRLAAPYTLNDRDPPGPIPEFSVSTRRGVARAQELLALGERRESKEQWRHTINQLPRESRSRLGEIALLRGWPDLAADAANAGSDWDRLDLRFPVAYWEAFEKAAVTQQVDSYLLLALARRESGLYALAKSKVGARGLMQVMPSTARTVLQDLGERYGGAASLYQPEINIPVGSAYLAALMARFDGNRVKSLAAYNAGPSRVSRWTNHDMAFDQWADSIPFGETREYVQAVLAYRVIYRLRAGEPASLLTAEERQAAY